MSNSTRRRRSSIHPRSDNIPDATRDESQGPIQAATSSPNASLLMLVSDACNNHRESAPHLGKTGVVLGQDQPLPLKCQRDLEALGKLLPKVNAAYQAPTFGERNRRRSIHATDVSHFCRFYWSVLTGGFCPHSLFLFNWGKDVTEILSQVHQLYRHLPTKSTIQNTFDLQIGDNADNGNKQEKPLEPVANEICSIIAHLLNLIPERRIQQLLVRDLLALSSDLATIATADIFGHQQEQDGDNNRDANALELVIFGETAACLDGSNDKGVEYTVHVSGVEELLALQAGNFAVLKTLLTLQKTKRTETPDGDSCISTDLPSSFVDCYFCNCLGEKDLMTSLVTAAGQALLYVPRKYAANATAKEQDRLRLMATRNRSSASRLLSMLLQDWDLCPEPSVSDIAEVAMLTSRAVLDYFRTRPKLASERVSMHRDNSCYMSLLSQLVCDAVLFPPGMEGHARASRIVWDVRCQALIPFLDCIPLIIGEDMERMECSYWSSEESTLRTIVLRTIHASIYTASPGSLDTITEYSPLCRQASSHCTAHGIFPFLFSLLKDTTLSSVTISIISKLFLPTETDSTIGVFDFATVCSIAWSAHTQLHGDEIRGVHSSIPSNTDMAAAANSDQNHSTPPSGSKRKRLSFSTSPKENGTVRPQQLQIQHSPKRQRSNRRGDSVRRPIHFTTPSPFSGSYPFHDANTGNTSTDSFDQAFGDVLNDALEIAAYVLSNPDSFLDSIRLAPSNAGSTGSGYIHNSPELRDVLVVTNVSRLILEVLYRNSRYCEKQQKPNDCKNFQAAIDILCYIFKSLTQLCVCVASSLSRKTADGLGGLASVLKATDFMTTVGLHAHFVSSSLLTWSGVGSLEPALNTTLDMFSFVSLITITKCAELEAKPPAVGVENKSGDEENKESVIERTVHGKHCRGLCRKLFQECVSTRRISLHGLTAPEGMFGSPCLCGFHSESSREIDGVWVLHGDVSPNWGKRKCVSGQNGFQNDCAGFLLGLLPQQSRCALLSCLHPVEGDTSIFQDPALSSLAGSNAMLSTLDRICKIVEPSASSSDTAVVSALAGLPVLLLSLVVRVTEKSCTIAVPPADTSTLEGPDVGEDENDVTSRLAEVLTRFQFLKNVLPHAISPFGSKESPCRPAVSRAACVTIVRLQAIFELVLESKMRNKQNLPIVPISLVSQILFSADGLLAYLTTTPGCKTQRSPICQDQVKGTKATSLEGMYGTIRRTLLSTQFTENVSTVPPDVRYEKWKCIAWTCLRSNRSDLRQRNADPEQIVHLAMRYAGNAKTEHSVVADPPRHEGDMDERPATVLPSLLWLVYTAFADAHSFVRNYASRALGQVLLGNSSLLLEALFSEKDEEWKTSQRHLPESMDNVRLRQGVTPMVKRLFHLIDFFLCKFCYVPQSQLSYTMTGYHGASEAACAASEQTNSLPHEALTALPFQRSAILALSSLCHYADIDTVCGMLVFEHAFLRLVRFWTAVENQSEVRVGDMVGMHNPISALAFGTLSKINLCRPLSDLIRKKCMASLVPAIFVEILVPYSSPIGVEKDLDCIAPESRQRQYHLLFVFIGSFLARRKKESGDDANENAGSFESRSTLQVLDFVDEALPKILPALVVEQDYDSLRLTTGFRIFLLGEYRRIENRAKKLGYVGTTVPRDDSRLVGEMPTESTWKARLKLPGVREATTELEEQTKLHCLSTQQIHHILSQLLLHPDRHPLVFFLRTVLKNKVPLSQMVKPKHLKLLRALVLRLGDVDCSTNEISVSNFALSDSYVVKAIRKGALAMEQDPQNRDAPTGDNSSVDRTASLTGPGSSGDVGTANSETGRSSGGDAASRWISSSFMYLLVNVVSYKWKIRSPDEKIRALKCLKAILHFLIPSESPQYLPQILATINMAVTDDIAVRDKRMGLRDVLHMRLLAIQALSHFVRIVVGHNHKSLGSNLTTIVVSLFPVISPQEVVEQESQEFRFIEETSKVAVELLEWMTGGDLGKHLAPLFSEIPFLPPSSNLDNVRSTLKANGINFDNLMVSGSPGTSTHPGLSASGRSSENEEQLSRRHFSSHRQAALHKRLHMLRDLLSHENISVRKVVLRHLTDLLLANRPLFHSLIESQDGKSTDRSMTVIYSDSAAVGDDVGIGSVASLLQSLLSRCVIEDDAEATSLLATTLGEIGAIDSNRIGDIKADAVQNTLHDDGSWMLLQPPWQSTVTRYQLQLVTKHLVTALRASPTSADQHQIAFTIQQLLVLLDKSSKHSAPSIESNIGTSVPSCDQVDVSNDHTLPRSSKAERGDMNAWLVEQLRKAGVLETIEPFWSSSFRESDHVSFLRKPPFFRTAPSYFHWISRWCGFMVKRSKENEGSRWRDFFYACRTALKSAAGISVIEFIVPLLVLDSVCFGDSQDERILLQEIKDSLTFSDIYAGSSVSASPNNPDSEGTSTVGMKNRSERQKAVNAVFSVIDILEYWLERETEERHRGARPGKSSRSAGTLKEKGLATPGTASNTHWPSDQSIARIADFLHAVPLSLRARAAAAVGMHARALRILEMDARAHVVGIVFDNADDRSRGRRNGQGVEWQKPLGSHIVDGIDIGLMKHVLGKLDDSYTMKAVGQKGNQIDLTLKLRDSIREREACGDWAGAIQDYERALQLAEKTENSPLLRKGLLRCLLELGQFDSVLNQVHGVICERPRGSGFDGIVSIGTSKHAYAIPFAVEAAWRLGRWSVLETLVDEGKIGEGSRLDAEGLYQVSVGRAMLALKRKSGSTVAAAVKEARDAVMTTLSSCARESYSRCYGHILRLHCLREIENASDRLCSIAEEAQKELSDIVKAVEFPRVSMSEEWHWDSRLDVVSSLGTTTIINVRLALARLARESETEGSLFLTVGKNARKSGLFHIAENSLAQAEVAFARLGSPGDRESQTLVTGDFLSSVQMQLAKLKHCEGESGSALRILGQDDVHRLISIDDAQLRGTVAKLELQKSQFPGATTEREAIDRFARRVLQSTQWMVEGGLKGGGEVMSRFVIVQKLCPNWEKAHFCFAKYVDSLLECRISAMANQTTQLGVDDESCRATVLFRDPTSRKYLLSAMKNYGAALKASQKHVYQVLPRLLTLWFDFTSIDSERLSPRKGLSAANGTGQRSHSVQAAGSDNHERFYSNQSDANDLMLSLYKAIPSQSFYTAMPQLISRVGHRDQDTDKIVRTILARVLLRFPSRALWALAWLRNSVIPARSNIGESIFKEAQKSLQKCGDTRNYDLLVDSKGLFRFLIDLAKYQPKEASSRSCIVRPWSGGVDLTEFVPPVQAALAVSQPSLQKSSSRDVFPALVPRMRSFCGQIQIMTSKARPKKLKAFVVPAQQLRSSRLSAKSSAGAKGAQPGDIGEMHFLVKQEARGDLRKDARVQDLNTVINRLLATSSSSTGGNAARQHRRLHLRTFSVVCLSEECGIIEWVPHTDSLRNLVAASYNPQAAPFSIRRRGRRIANWGDINLRKTFEQCQTMYKTDGNLARAAAMFEEKCLKAYPPVLYWWFVQHFLDPHAWYEARTRFTMSTAAWSAVGHVIGLGDRHSENILVDTSSGDCVHVDFDCIFDKGLALPQPEIVPFRLTPNMVDAFGPTGADGTFTGCLTTAMSTLRGNRDTLLSVLEPFLKDPVIDWKRHRSQQKPSDKAAAHETKAAKRSMKGIDGRLKGIYNLRVPPSKRVRRTDGVYQDDEMSQLIPLSVEGQVQKMISEATSSENLVQIYMGWMPWV